MSLEQVSANAMFGGKQLKLKHTSKVLNCDMIFSVYLPPQATTEDVPVIYWLSGLTCTDDNFVQKAGAQQFAAQAGVAIVCPDTSPRGEGVPDDPDGAYDFGLGAGFYVNATQDPWKEHYHMYDYVTQELPQVLADSDLPLHGRSRRPDHRPEKSGQVQGCFSLCANLFTPELPLGRKGAIQLHR